MMRKILFFVFTVLFFPSITEARTLNVVATTTDLMSIASEIGGEKITATSLARGTQDHHYVEPRPSMVVTLRNADLVIMIGMDHDIWVQSLINSARNSNIRFGRPGYLDVSAGIEKKEIPVGKIDASMGHIHIYGNPHYWLDPLNTKIIAGTIAERLSSLLPEHSAYFKENLQTFNDRIDERMVYWKNKLAPFEGEGVVVYHTSWPYFTDRFGLETIIALEPKPGIPPSPAHLREVINVVNANDARVVMIEVFHNERPARFVADQTGSEVVVLPSSVGGVEEAVDYFALMDVIVEKLSGAFER